MPTSIKIPATYSENKKGEEEEMPPRLFGSISIIRAIRGFRRRSNRTRSQECATIHCTSSNSKVGATLLRCKRICKCTHQSSDTASNQYLHPRLPTPSIQNEQESPMARWRRPRTLWNHVDRSQWLNIPSNQTHHQWLCHQANKYRFHSQITKSRY
jgi:hypothetical protein